MGGAYSVDRAYRELGKTYWKQELPNQDDFDECIKNLNIIGCRVDFILTHFAPASIIDRLGMSPHGCESDLNDYLENVLNLVEFRHWYFGHYHIDKNLFEDATCVYHKIIRIV